MYCPHCGSQLPDGAAFCGHCGKPVAPQPVADAAQPNASAPQPAPAPSPVSGPQSAPPFAAAPGSVPPGVPPAPAGQSPFDVKPPKKPFRVTRGMTIGIFAVAVVAVVAIVLAVSGVFGGGAHKSAQGIADQTDALFDDLMQSDFDSAAFEKFGSGIIDLIPPELIDSALEETGRTREELIQYMGSSLGGSMEYYASTPSSYTDMFTISIDVELGDRLDSYDIESINDALESSGCEGVVTEGYYLTGEVSVTFNEDYEGYSAGETESEDMGNIGVCAIKIGNSWYLWPGVY